MSDTSVVDSEPLDDHVLLPGPVVHPEGVGVQVGHGVVVVGVAQLATAIRKNFSKHRVTEEDDEG